MKSNLEFYSYSHAEKSLKKIDLENLLKKRKKKKRSRCKLTIKQVCISFCKHPENLEKVAIEKNM